MKIVRIIVVLSFALFMSLTAWYGLADRPQEKPSIEKVRKKPSRPKDVIPVIQPMPGDAPEPVSLPPPIKLAVAEPQSKQAIRRKSTDKLSQKEKTWLENHLLEIEADEETNSRSLENIQARIDAREAVVEDPEAYVLWSDDEHTLNEISQMTPEAAEAFTTYMIAREAQMQASQELRPIERHFWAYEARSNWELKVQETREDKEETHRLLGLPPPE